MIFDLLLERKGPDDATSYVSRQMHPFHADDPLSYTKFKAWLHPTDPADKTPQLSATGSLLRTNHFIRQEVLSLCVTNLTFPFVVYLANRGNKREPPLFQILHIDKKRRLDCVPRRVREQLRHIVLGIKFCSFDEKLDGEVEGQDLVGVWRDALMKVIHKELERFPKLRSVRCGFGRGGEERNGFNELAFGDGWFEVCVEGGRGGCEVEGHEECWRMMRKVQG